MKARDLLARAWVHAVVTCNDDFTDPFTSLPRLTGRLWPKWLRRKAGVKRAPLLVLCQEVKNTRLRDRLPQRFGVHQVMDSAATRGVAVVWDTEQGAPYPDRRRNYVHAGWDRLVSADGVAMEDRGVAWIDLEVGRPGSGRVVRAAAAHRPPKRYSRKWAAFDRALREWAEASPYPVLLGIDGNTSRLRRWARTVGFPKSRARGIDGVLGRGRGIRPVGQSKALAKGRSDHHPIRTLWRIGRTVKG